MTEMPRKDQKNKQRAALHDLSVEELEVARCPTRQHVTKWTENHNVDLIYLITSTLEIPVTEKAGHDFAGSPESKLSLDVPTKVVEGPNPFGSGRTGSLCKGDQATNPPF